MHFHLPYIGHHSNQYGGSSLVHPAAINTNTPDIDMSLPQGSRNSFITNDDLASLEFESVHRDYLLFSSLSDDSSTLCDDVGAPCGERRRRVGFCPFAVMISCAALGEKEDVLKLGTGGRPRLALKTYSLDAPNFQKSTSKAWSKVVTSFSASLQPLLSHGNGGDGVASFSPRSPIDLPTPKSPSTSSSSPSNRSSSFDVQRKQDDEAMFIPSSSGRINLRLPTICRKPRGRSASASECRGILKSPERRPTLPLPSPPVQSTSAQPVTLSQSPTALFPPVHASLSHSPTGISHSLTPVHLANLHTIPLRPCCPHCTQATELGVQEQYEEHWSKSARRKRRADRKILEKAGELWNAGDEEGAKNHVGIATCSKLSSTTESGGGEGAHEEDVPLLLGRVSRAKVDDVVGVKEEVLSGEGEEEGEKEHLEEEVATASTTTTPIPSPGLSLSSSQADDVLPPLSSPSLSSSSLPSTPEVSDALPLPLPTPSPALSTSTPASAPITSLPPPSDSRPIVEGPPFPRHTSPPKPVKPKRKFSLSSFGAGIVDGAFSVSTGSAGRGFI